MIDRVDPLIELFIRDLTEGIAGTRVRAGMLKVMTDVDGITPDVARVMTAVAVAQRDRARRSRRTRTPRRATASCSRSRFRPARRPPDRIIIGHSGDSEDLDYLMELMNNGSTIGMDRFGMEHVLPDERRSAPWSPCSSRGTRIGIVISHDAAFYSHVTPPSWGERVRRRGGAWTRSRVRSCGRSEMPASPTMPSSRC